MLNYFVRFVTYSIHCMQFLTEYSINMITPIICTSSRSTNVIINSLVTNLILPSLLNATIMFLQNKQDQYHAFHLIVKIKFPAGFSVIKNSLSLCALFYCGYLFSLLTLVICNVKYSKVLEDYNQTS